LPCPAARQAAPFFLPTVPSLAPNPVFDTAGAEAGASRVRSSRRALDGAPGDDGPLSALMRLIQARRLSLSCTNPGNAPQHLR